MKLHIRFLFLAITLLVIELKAQTTKNCTFSIKGYVINGENNQPLEGVSVASPELNTGTLTDINGYFEINLCEGNDTLVYQYIGYKTFTRVYYTKSNIEDRILLHTDTCDLPSVTIYGLRDNELATVTKNSLEGKALDRTRGLTLGDALKEIPGVAVFQTGPSIVKPVIHGMHSNRIVILNGGLRQESQQWGSEHAPEIDPYVSDQITVIKGAAGIRYGSDALGGVVIVEPRRLRTKPGIGAEINLAGFSNNRQGTTSGLIEGNFKKIPALSWRLQGTFRQAGNSKAPRYYMANTGYKEINFSYSIGYNTEKYGVEIFYSQFNTDLGIFPDSHNGSLAEFLNALHASEPKTKAGFTYDIKRPSQHVEHELFRAKAYLKLNNLGKLNLILGRQFNDRSEYDLHKPYNDALAALDGPQLRLKLTTYTADLILDHRIKSISGQWGVNGMKQTNTWEGRDFIPFFGSNSIGAFVIERWRKNKIELEGGLRYDFKSLEAYVNRNNIVETIPYQFNNVSGAIGLNIFINEHTTVRNNIGSNWRPPSVNELFSKGLHHGAAAFEFGDRNLKPERAYKVISTLEHKSKKLAFEVSAYYQLIEGYIYLKPDSQLMPSSRGTFPSFHFTQTNASFWGLDLMADYSFTKEISAIVKGSVVNAWNMTTHDYLINIPPYRADLTLKYEPQWNDFLKKNSIYGSIGALFVARQAQIPRDSDAPMDASGFRLVHGDFALPPSDYYLVNVETGADIVIGKQKISVSLEVKNLFNRSYRDYMNRFRFYTDEPGRNIMLRIKIPIEII